MNRTRPLRKIWLLLLLVTVIGCSPDISKNLHTNTPKIHCDEILGADQILNDNMPNILIFGELHGTKESPKFIENMVCLSLASNYPTILAIEFSEQYKQDISIFFNSPVHKDAEKKILDTPYWFSGNQDGKRSVAMFDLLVAVKSMKQTHPHLKLDVFGTPINFFKPAKNMKMKELNLARDKVFAHNILEINKNYPDHKLIVLTGNYHSALYDTINGVRNEVTMASFLPKEQFLTFYMNSQAGSFWQAFLGNTKSGSNVSKAFTKNGIPIQTPAIHLFSAPKDEHHGAYYTVTKTVSFPTNDD